LANSVIFDGNYSFYDQLNLFVSQIVIDVNTESILITHQVWHL